MSLFLISNKQEAVQKDKRNIRKERILIASLVLNFLFLSYYAIQTINSPSDRVGILTEDVKIYFNVPYGQKEPNTLFVVIPKGVTVRDASPRGFDHVDLFEPYRFKMTFTSDDPVPIDYHVDPKGRTGLFGLHSVQLNKAVKQPSK